MKSPFVLLLARVLRDAVLGLSLVGALGTVWYFGSLTPVVVADNGGETPTPSLLGVGPTVVEPTPEPPPVVERPEEDPAPIVNLVEAAVEVASNQPIAPPGESEVESAPPPPEKSPTGWGGGFLVKAPEQIVMEAPPPPEKVVEQLFTAPALNKFGNPEGDEYGLTMKKEFEGAELLVWSIDPEVIEYIFTTDNPLWAAVKDKGFKLRIERGPFNKDWLENADQMWMFSGKTGGLTEETEAAIVEFVDAGKGLYIAAENEPYYVDADRLTQRMFSTRISGNYAGGNLIAVRGHGVTAEDFAKASLNNQGGNQEHAERREIINKATHYAEEHPLLTDVNFIFEGITISHIHPIRELQTVLKARDGQILAAVAVDPNRRVVVDCGWTRYYFSPQYRYVTETAGTVRYAENIAAYLMGKDERGGTGGDWRKWRTRRRKVQELAQQAPDDVLAAFAAADPEDRVTAIIAAQKLKLDCPERYLELLLDPADDVRQQARSGLQELAGGDDFGPQRRAGAAELQASHEKWQQWLVRYRLVQSFETYNEAGILSKLTAVDPLDRWAAVTVIGRKKINRPDELIARLEDEAPQVREQARHALVALSGVDFGPATTDDAATLAAVVDWKRWRLKGKYPDLFRGAESKLSAALQSSQAEERWAAVAAIRARGVKLIADLIARLDDEDRLVRLETISALQELSGRNFALAPDAPAEEVTAAKRELFAWWKEETEKTAQRAMRMAKSVLEKNKPAGYRRLEEIVRNYPESDAAAEARRLMADRPSE